MANITKLKRDKMLQFLHDLKKVHTDDASIRAFNEIENALLEKKFGLVFEEHTEAVDEKLKEYIPVLCADKTRKICKDPNLPYNFIIEGDNLQALYLLEKTHKGKVDCIYIDPPYNTGAKDWKYNNDYVDERDAYRHSKWLSMMKTRLLLAKRLLNPDNSVLICTIDEKEYLHLGCLLEELFPEARMQMISSVIHPGGVAMDKMFYRSDEYLFYVFLGNSSPQKIPLGEEWLGGVKNTCKGSLHWASLRRMDGTTKFDSPGCFYPIFVRKDGKKIIDIGDPVPLDMDRNSVLCPKDAVAIFPIRTDNIEGRWGISPQKCREKWEKGFLKLGNFTKFGMSIMYLREGEEKKVLSGEFEVVGYREDGSIIVDEEKHQAAFIPTTQWRISTHDADKQGTRIINCLLAGKRFNYPKSLYAVKDSLNFIVANNPEALIVDFFAGSGTTLHAVNLLNAEDGGRRKCIMVTNNEISAEEEKRLRDKGLKKGDAEWDAFQKQLKTMGVDRYIQIYQDACDRYYAEQ